MRIIVALFLMSVINLKISYCSNVTYDKYNEYKLPLAIQPRNYKLEVETHLGDDEGFRFRGRVWITVSKIRVIFEI